MPPAAKRKKAKPKKAQRKASKPTAKKASKKETQALIKPVLPKQEHRVPFQNFVKFLHAQGVNVSVHSKLLTVEEAELTAAEKALDTKHELKPKELDELKKVLNHVLALSYDLETLEHVFEQNVQPLLKGVPTHSFKSLNALKKLSATQYKKKSIKWKADIKPARDPLLASFYFEEKQIFHNLAPFLESLEVAAFNLLVFEHKFRTAKHSNIFTRVNHDVQKIMHEDVHVLFQTLIKTQEARISAFQWMALADQGATPRVVPTLEKELGQLIYVRDYYRDLFVAHANNLETIYTKFEEEH